LLSSGCTLPLPHPLEMEVSEMLCEDIPCAEMVAFGKTGSDACTLAVRLARGYTGRHKVLTCGYHGWQDWFAELVSVQSVPSRAEKLVFRVPFNDVEGFRNLLSEHRNDLAAVILEPAGPAGGHPQGSGEDVDPAFLHAIATETRTVGALLIFDEIITGFRYPGGSVQHATGIIPDLACFGKALGAGLPISAVVGRADVFNGAMPHAFYGPTFKGETYSLAAAKAALHVYRNEPVSQHVEAFGRRLKEAADEICRALGIDAKMIGPPFRTSLAFNEPDPVRLKIVRTLYVQELMKNRLITYHGIMLPSYAHDASAFEETLTAMGAALRTVQQAIASNTLRRCLQIPVNTA
jgi:glutamate-1-semialdehyde 2,1-aminomutase